MSNQRLRSINITCHLETCLSYGRWITFFLIQGAGNVVLSRHRRTKDLLSYVACIEDQTH